MPEPTGRGSREFLTAALLPGAERSFAAADVEDSPCSVVDGVPVGWWEGKAKRSDGKALVRALDAKVRPTCRPMAGVDALRRANQQREIDWSGLPTVTCRREAPQRRGAIKVLAHH